MKNIRLKGRKTINRMISHLPGVRGAVFAKAQSIAFDVSLRLDVGSENRTGESEVLVRRGTTDSYVILEDEAAMAIEFGHWVRNEDGTMQYVPGKYAITGAAGLV